MTATNCNWIWEISQTVMVQKKEQIVTSSVSFPELPAAALSLLFSKWELTKYSMNTMYKREYVTPDY